MIVSDAEIDAFLHTIDNWYEADRSACISDEFAREWVRAWLNSLPRDIHDHRNFRLPTGKTHDRT